MCHITLGKNNVVYIINENVGYLSTV